MRGIMISLMLLFASASVHAETAKDVFSTLKKMQIRCSTGISFKEYTEELANIKYTFSMYQSTDGATDGQELVSGLEDILKDYENARSYWEIDINYSKYNFGHTEMAGVDFSRYPKARERAENGGAISNFRNTRTNQWEDMVMLGAMRNVIWGAASGKVDEMQAVVMSQKLKESVPVSSGKTRSTAPSAEKTIQTLKKRISKLESENAELRKSSCKQTSK